MTADFNTDPFQKASCPTNEPGRRFCIRVTQKKKTSGRRGSGWMLPLFHREQGLMLITSLLPPQQPSPPSPPLHSVSTSSRRHQGRPPSAAGSRRSGKTHGRENHRDGREARLTRTHKHTKQVRSSERSKNFEKEKASKVYAHVLP